MMQPPDFTWPDLSFGLVPIVVGVTGHRFVRDDAQEDLGTEVEGILSRLRESYPHSPLLLLTPLAEGADQLVAKIAEEQGIRLVVPTPFPIDKYRTTFETDEGRDRFDRWRNSKHVERWIPMPRVPDPPDGPPLDPAARDDLQYALVGAFVARYSHFLIALWDGAETKNVGGTDQVVHYRRSGKYEFDRRLQDCLENLPEPYALRSNALETGATGPVLWVVTPRKGDDATKVRTQNLAPLVYYRDMARLEDNHDAQKYFWRIREIYKRIDGFNCDSLRQMKRDRGSIEKCRADLYPPGEESLPPTLENVGNCFGLADSLAQRHQRITYRALTTMLLMVFAAAALFAAFAHLVLNQGVEKSPGYLPYGHWPLSGYAAFLALADAVYLFVRYRDSQNKFQDYRSLAEGLRTQFYWLLAGLGNSASDHYLRKQKNELLWIRTAIGGWSVRTAPLEQGNIGAVCRLWVLRQADYFKSAMAREGRRLAVCNGLGGALVLASIIGAINEVSPWRRPSGLWPWMDAIVAAALIVFAFHFTYVIRDSVKEAREEGWERPIESAAWYLFGIAAAFVFVELLVCAVDPSNSLIVQAIPKVIRAWASTHFSKTLSEHLTFWHSISRHLTPETHGWLVVGLGLTAVAGALVHTYGEKRAFGVHGRQYKRMYETYSRASTELADLLRAGHPARATKVLLDLGREALAEQGDWVILHRERPIDVPQAEM